MLRWVNTVISLQLSVNSEENIINRRMVIKFTDRKHLEIKLELFFDTATTNGWRGTLEVFGQRSRAKALILCGYYT